MLRRFYLISVLSALALASGLLACSKKPDFEITNLVIREAPPGRSMTAAYLSIENFSDKSLALNYAHSPAMEEIEIHRHLYEDGQMKMREVKHLVVEPHSRLDFKPGGFHLMLFGIDDSVKAGAMIDVTLEFDGHPPLTLPAEVKRL